MTIQTGDKVRIHYRGTLKEDGTEFDNSAGRDPLEFTAGGPELIAGVSHAVIGMDVGEKKTVEVPPNLGYGDRREDMKIQVPREQLPDGVQVGAVLGVQTPGGEFQATLVELAEETAVLDGNHFLAGKTLVFDLEVVGVGEVAG
jgi:peptidylprolyl isomerase